MVTGIQLDETAVRTALAGVADPEIPAISVLELGLVSSIEIVNDRVKVECLPTFVGCPALDVIREDIEEALIAIGAVPKVIFVYSPPWTSDRITAEGREKLHEYGLAPPASTRSTSVELLILSSGECPYCGSKDTVLESPFGPTACRSICYCRSCRNPYERFKNI